MKLNLTATLSILCLGAGVLTVWAGTQTLAQTLQADGPVASEYNPPGRSGRRGSYPGGTRFIEPTPHRNYV
ncbi:MAG: hypothetical protein AAFO87_09490 [Cyanobacteria bacterium J06607_6]